MLDWRELDALVNAKLDREEREAKEMAQRNGNGHAQAPRPKEADAFPAPIPSSALRQPEETKWIVEGYFARGTVTLLTALWKAGKTTFLAHLLGALEGGGAFCGQATAAARVLYVTEENEGRWAERRDDLGLTDHVHFLIRPFRCKPDWLRWREFLAYLAALQKDSPVDLIVFDTLSNLWPVRDENEAPQVQAALMPLHDITGEAGLSLVHHNRKGDGKEATAARGSGALAAFVDTIIEFRRYDPENLKDRRRVLTGYGRYSETPEEVVIELGEGGYRAQGDRCDMRQRDAVSVLLDLLPRNPPGLTLVQIQEEWPEEGGVRRQTLVHVLRHGAEVGSWSCSGEGMRGSPYRFWKPG